MPRAKECEVEIVFLLSCQRHCIPWVPLNRVRANTQRRLPHWRSYQGKSMLEEKLKEFKTNKEVEE